MHINKKNYHVSFEKNQSWAFICGDNEQMNAHEEKRILRCKKMLKYQRF